MNSCIGFLRDFFFFSNSSLVFSFHSDVYNDASRKRWRDKNNFIIKQFSFPLTLTRLWWNASEGFERSFHDEWSKKWLPVLGLLIKLLPDGSYQRFFEEHFQTIQQNHFRSSIWWWIRSEAFFRKWINSLRDCRKNKLWMMNDC